MKRNVKKLATIGMVVSALLAAPMMASAYTNPQAGLDSCLAKAKKSKDQELARSECYWHHDQTWRR